MSIVASYLHQTATWKRVVGLNEYGEPLSEEQEIHVRWEGKRRLVRDKEGHEVVSEARVYCMEPVQPGDIFEFGGRNWPIIAVSEVPDLGGSVGHREVAI